MLTYHNSPETGAFLPSQKIFDRVIQAVSSPDALGMAHDALEDLIEKEGRPLLLQLFRDNVRLRAALEKSQAQHGEMLAPVGEDGVERQHMRDTRRALKTVFGDANIDRLSFTARGAKGGLRPLDAQLNLPHDSYSFGVRKRACILAMDVGYGSATEKLHSVGGITLGKRQMEGLVRRAAMDFEAFYEQRHSAAEQVPPACSAVQLVSCEGRGNHAAPCSAMKERCDLAACSVAQDELVKPSFTARCTRCRERPGILALSSDGKGIVMRKDSLRPATRASAEKSTTKLNSRLSAGEKKNRKRMAEVAAVYEIGPRIRSPKDVIDPDASRNQQGEQTQENGAADRGKNSAGTGPRTPRPVNKRVWASLVESVSGVIDEVFDEAAYRDPEHELTWVFLLDGNKDQIAAAKRHAKRLRQEHGVTLHIVVDFIHVLEYLWKAAWCFFDKGDPAAEEWVLKRAHRVLQGGSAGVAQGIKQSATKRGLSKKQRAGADTCARYLKNKKELLRYDVYMSLGLPIATGVIEGACRHLINDRFNITGARWSLDGAEAILKLRSLRSSGDFEEYWEFHRQQEWERNHLSLYQKGEIEPPRMTA